MRQASLALGFLFSLSIVSTAHAANYDDVASDLSNLNTTPTLVSVSAGSNVITGRSGTQNGIDLDYFRISVPPGFRLSAINLTAFDGPSLTFLGVERGTSFTPAASTTQAQLLGWVHFSTALVGTDILDNMGVGAGAQGFVGPLGAGDYTFWLQENSTPVVNYQLNLVLTAVPIVPAVSAPFAWLLAGGLLLAGAASLRRLRFRSS